MDAHWWHFQFLIILWSIKLSSVSVASLKPARWFERFLLFQTPTVVSLRKLLFGWRVFGSPEPPEVFVGHSGDLGFHQVNAQCVLIWLFGTNRGMSDIRHRRLKWKRSSISIFELETDPQSWIPYVQMGIMMDLTMSAFEVLSSLDFRPGTQYGFITVSPVMWPRSSWCLYVSSKSASPSKCTPRYFAEYAHRISCCRQTVAFFVVKWTDCN